MSVCHNIDTCGVLCSVAIVMLRKPRWRYIREFWGLVISCTWREGRMDSYKNHLSAQFLPKSSFLMVWLFRYRERRWRTLQTWWSLTTMNTPTTGYVTWYLLPLCVWIYIWTCPYVVLLAPPRFLGFSWIPTRHFRNFRLRTKIFIGSFAKDAVKRGR